MVYDQSTIYVLGRYVDYSFRSAHLPNDMYAYNTDTYTWTCICDDTAKIGGPRCSFPHRHAHLLCSLIYDHQMVIDSISRTMFVFGGRLLNRQYTSTSNPWQRATSLAMLTPSRFESGRTVGYTISRHTHAADMDRQHLLSSAFNEPSYSGLYAYHMNTNEWRQLRCDIAELGRRDLSDEQLSLGVAIKGVWAQAIRCDYCGAGRSGHSMQFDPLTRKLYILAGMRNRTMLSDMLVYDIDSDTLQFALDHGKHTPCAGEARTCHSTRLPVEKFCSTRYRLYTTLHY
jgi:hypothetical protein